MITYLSPTNSQTIPVRIPPPSARSNAASPVVSHPWASPWRDIHSSNVRVSGTKLWHTSSVIALISKGGSLHRFESSGALVASKSRTLLILPVEWAVSRQAERRRMWWQSDLVSKLVSELQLAMGASSCGRHEDPVITASRCDQKNTLARGSGVDWIRDTHTPR